MARNNNETIENQKTAMAEALKKIEKCRISHSKTLEIGHNQYLSVFPEEIRQLTWLTNLYVLNTDIKVLPDWIGELENLTVLNISYNVIQELPSSIVNLIKLKKLIIVYTGIKKLPSFIGKLHSLEYLEIAYNIEKIPQCILDLPKLKRIETGGWDNSHLPALVAKQYELNFNEYSRRFEHCKKNKSKKLDLSYLYLGKIPKELSDLYWLEELILTGNELTQEPINNFV